MTACRGPIRLGWDRPAPADLFTHIERPAAMTTNTADQLIARLPVEERSSILDALVATTRGGTVAVEHSSGRKLDGATTTIGELLGVAFAPGAPTSHVLIVKPAKANRRLVALSAAHVLRVRWASTPSDDLTDVDSYRLGSVLAGPAVKATA